MVREKKRSAKVDIAEAKKRLEAELSSAGFNKIQDKGFDSFTYVYLKDAAQRDSAAACLLRDVDALQGALDKAREQGGFNQKYLNSLAVAGLRAAARSYHERAQENLKQTDNKLNLLGQEWNKKVNADPALRNNKMAETRAYYDAMGENEVKKEAMEYIGADIAPIRSPYSLDLLSTKLKDVDSLLYTELRSSMSRNRAHEPWALTEGGRGIIKDTEHYRNPDHRYFTVPGLERQEGGTGFIPMEIGKLVAMGGRPEAALEVVEDE